MGKKILNGNFNLMSISFPIKCMGALTVLEVMPTAFTCCSVYLNKAASITDPLERMKLTMASSIAFMFPTKIWDKPLNPVLGETYEASFADGAKLYVEQTSHHPPISNFLIEGPNNAYTISGWSNYTVTAGMNNATLVSKGHKKIVFHDGHTIVYNLPGDYLFNLAMGTMGHQMTGTINFTDE